MAVYIQSTANISPQKTFGTALFLDEPLSHEGNRLTCLEPDYTQIINPKLIRRMSRVIKLGVSAALACLKLAGVVLPDAIITATAYGCLDDTGIFLSNMVEQGEEPLSPTAFVHSTHNTIGAQIALLLQCHQYNNTFVNGGASFENALTDAMMLLMENNGSNVLVGAIDEITNISHAILSRMGLYKSVAASNLSLYNTFSKGTIAGEGAAFFLLSAIDTGSSLAKIDGLTTFYKPAGTIEAEEQIRAFFAEHRIGLKDIDLLIMGDNGDTKNDFLYQRLRQSIFKTIPFVNYKHLCGEYPTSTGFALWLGAKIIETNTIPAALGYMGGSTKPIKNVLIYNHYQNKFHSLILVSSC